MVFLEQKISEAKEEYPGAEPSINDATHFLNKGEGGSKLSMSVYKGEGVKEMVHVDFFQV